MNHTRTSFRAVSLITKSVLIAGALMLIAFSQGDTPVTTAGVADGDNVAGWAWGAVQPNDLALANPPTNLRSGVGFVSLSNSNMDSPNRYGLKLSKNADGQSFTLSGWAFVHWGDPNSSDTKGEWLCFGDTCNQAGIWESGQSSNQVPFDGCSDKSVTTTVVQDPDSPDYGIVNHGWARALSIGRYGFQAKTNNNWGWVSLTSENCRTSGTSGEYAVKVNFNTGELAGAAWGGDVRLEASSTGEVLQGTGLGYIQFQDRGLFTASGEIGGVATDIASGQPLQNVTILLQVFGNVPGVVATPAVGQPTNYQTVTNSNGAYLIQGVPPGTYRAAAVPSSKDAGQLNLKPSISNDVVVNSGAHITQNFKLTSGLGTGGWSQRGRVVDTSGNAVAGAYVVFINGSQSSVTNSNGEFTLTNLPVVPSYTIAALAPGYEAGSGTIPMGTTPLTITLTPSSAYKGRVIAPWILTFLGDIHSNEGIGTFGSFSPPQGYGSATYLLTAGDAAPSVVHFRSWAKNYSSDPRVRRQSWEIGPYNDIARSGGNFLLGSPIDFDTLWGEAVSSDLADIFGATGKLRLAGSTVNLFGGTFGSGARTVLVDGDLVIRGNLNYAGGQYTQNDLPSVAFVVRGNVTIDPSVTKTVGAIYVLPRQVGSLLVDGTLSTGSSDKRLDHQGMLVAYRFNFERTYTNDTPENVSLPFALPSGETQVHFDRYEAPSETIFYDGRAVLNSPPGLTDVSNIFPSWQEVLPE